MARNKVQFQKGLSEVGFDELYGTEDKCRCRATIRMRQRQCGHPCRGAAINSNLGLHCLSRRDNLDPVTASESHPDRR